MRFSWLISKYLIGAILPYFIFAWLLLSVILFVQQAGRFADIFFSVNIPTNLIWQLTLALIPNVIAFTCPMAALVGVIIGLSKMQGDSELTAIRAAGVGNWEITLPVAVVGLLLSLFAFFINLFGVPLAARIVRQVAMQTAIYKLESPIEPGVFNTEVAGLTIYVKDGDIANGNWKNIFIYNDDENSGTLRLITSSSGRIDSSDQLSELVLEDAVVSTFSGSGTTTAKFVSEKVGEIRYAVKTRRGELIEKLSSTDMSPEELGLAELSDYVGRKEGKERTEAQILWQRRIILSITPLIFCLLGTAMILRFSRRGRGFGIFVALISLISYYLLAFLGEQLARTGRISVVSGSLIPLGASLLAIVWFSLSARLNLRLGRLDRLNERVDGLSLELPKSTRRNVFGDLTTGLRDFDIVSNLLKFYLLTLGFLAAVFLIFTAFELWKFAGTIDNGILLLLQYLGFLLPFVYLQLAPSAAMVATLATYVIKSRQNEIITWTSAGQSVYRLLLPCLLFMLALGAVNWQIQERIAPNSNQVQDELRNRIRSRGVLANESGKFWVANNDRIFSFEINNAASDNEMEIASSCSSNCTVKNLSIYEFAGKGGELQSVYQISTAVWHSDRIRFTGPATKSVLGSGTVETVDASSVEVEEEANPFMEARKKPSHLNVREIKDQIYHSESDLERRNFSVALEKKYSTLPLPFIIALFTAPFALSLSRKGKVITVGYAVGLWLLFMGISSTFEQWGLSGSLSPTLAIWSPLLLFAMFGIYLTARVKT